MNDATVLISSLAILGAIVHYKTKTFSLSIRAKPKTVAASVRISL
jgi:hypothetical protein